MKVKCDYCGKEFEKTKYRVEHSKHHYCCTECMGKHREEIYTGEQNPNNKYHLPEDYWNNIDTEFKAWLLGWIATDGCIKKDCINIALQQNDVEVLDIIKNEFNEELPLYYHHCSTENAQFLVDLKLCSKQWVADICNYLNLSGIGEKASKLSTINIAPDLFRHFLRGVLEGDGHISKQNIPQVQIAAKSLKFLEFLKDNSPATGHILQNNNGNTLNYNGVNALDFLGFIYEDAHYYLPRKKDRYIELCHWTPILRGPGNSTKFGSIFVAKTDERAVLPSKTLVSDSGYDLTLIDVWKKKGNVTFYETGIKVTPPFGYYMQMVPRSSISKTGYILANNIGIIDRSYVGSIKVPLIKIDPQAPDLELPCRLVQIIPTPIEHMELIEVDSIEDTARGEGGFGSTGK